MKRVRRSDRADASRGAEVRRRPRHRIASRQSSFTATEAKNEFGRLLERAMQGEAVVITRHDAPKAVLISIEQFNALQRAPETKLNDLAGEFDALLDRMQRPGTSARTLAAFHASPDQLGKAAVGAARKRG